MLKAIWLDIMLMHYKIEPSVMLTTQQRLAVNFDRYIFTDLFVMGHASDFLGISLIHKKAVLSYLLLGMSTIEDIYIGLVQLKASAFYVAFVTSPSFLYEANTKRKGTLWQA